MKRMNKVVSLTVATALLLSSMDMIGVKASENIIEDTDAVKEQPLQEVTEVPGLQAVSASAPTVAATNSKDFVIEKGVLTKYNGKENNRSNRRSLFLWKEYNGQSIGTKSRLYLCRYRCYVSRRNTLRT